MHCASISLFSQEEQLVGNLPLHGVEKPCRQVAEKPWGHRVDRRLTKVELDAKLPWWRRLSLSKRLIQGDYFTQMSSNHVWPAPTSCSLSWSTSVLNYSIITCSTGEQCRFKNESEPRSSSATRGWEYSYHTAHQTGGLLASSRPLPQINMNDLSSACVPCHLSKWHSSFIRDSSIKRWKKQISQRHRWESTW